MKKKKLLSILFCMLMVVMQLSWSVTAIANSKTALKVSDIGDKNLYAVLATICDSDGSNGGILYKEDAELLTQLILNNTDISESVSKIESFSGLVTYCPNLERIDGTHVVSEAAYPSLIETIINLENITNIDAEKSCMTQDLFDKICSKKGIDKVTGLSIWTENIDISNIKNFKNIDYLEIYQDNNEAIKGAEALTGLDKLQTLKDWGNDNKYILNYLPDGITSLDIWLCGTESEVDISRFKNIESLTVRGVISKLEGIYSLEALKYIELYNSGDYVKVDLRKLPTILKRINIDKCDVVTYDDGFKEFSNLYLLDLDNCNINISAENIELPDDIQVLQLDNIGLDTIPSLKTYKNLYNISLNNNNITDISELKNVIANNNLYYIDVSNNNIDNISCLDGIESDNLRYLNLSGNNLTTLPNLTKLSGITGENENYSWESYLSPNKYNLSLAGNNIDSKYLTEEYVPAEYAKDMYWVYNASLKKSLDGKYYADKINETVISKSLDGMNYLDIYTSEQSFSLSDEFIKYIKENEKYLYIYYINGNGIADQFVTIDGSNLADNTTNVDISFKDFGSSDEIKASINKVFEPYGESDYYYVNYQFDNSVNGITYYIIDSSNSNSSVPDPNKSYIRYYFDNEENEFGYAGYYTPSNDDNSNFDKNIYFYVDNEKDGFMGIDSYTIQGDSYVYNTIYNKTSDDRVFLSDDIKYFVNNNINISTNILNKWKQQYYYSPKIYHYDINTHRTTSYVEVYAQQDRDTSLNVTFPTVTVKDSDLDIDEKLNGSTDYKIYDVKNVTDSTDYNSYVQLYGVETNIYEYYNNDFVYVGSSSGMNPYYEMKVNKDTKYIVIPKASDKLYNTLYGEVGDITYNNDSSSERILTLLKYDKEVNNISNITINTVYDKIVFNKDVLDYIKKNDLSVNINYYNSVDGKLLGTVSTSAKSLNEANVSEATIIERPDVKILTSNENFEKVFPVGIKAMYLIRNNNIVNGFSYTYKDVTSISEKLTENSYEMYALSDSEQGYEKIDTLYSNSLSDNGFTLISDEVIALIGSNGFPKPSEKPTEPTTEAPTEETKPTETEPTTEQTRATEIETTTEQTKATETETTTEVTKPTENTTEATTAETKPAETTTEVTTAETKPAETTTEVTTAETKPAETTTEVTTAETKPVETTTEVTTAEIKLTENTTEGTKSTEEPTQDTKPDNRQTDVIGVNSGAEVVDEEDIVEANEVSSVLDSAMDTSILSRVETNSKEIAPKLSASIFSKMKENQKDLTVGVTDENNRLKYSWSFDSDKITNPNMDIDLSMSFDTDRAEAIEKITERTDVMYLAFAHHGQLPAPAKMKVYVGDRYANGEIVYLYYFNEEKNVVEAIGRGGLVVNAGYIEYTITHCSVYFLSKETAEAINAVEIDSDNNDNSKNNDTNSNDENVTSDNNIASNNTTQATNNSTTQATSATNSNSKSNDNVQSGDKTNPVPYAVSALVGIVALVVLMFASKRKNNK